jgi:DNA polymerase III subunit gamma/tau
VSLYRTWRPLTFADLVGQDAVVRTLTAAIESGRLAHAYLFSGPRGSGKTSAAKILARCIDCVNGPTANPDNTCDNCRAMLAGTALDVLEIDAASNRGIDEIRALREAVKFAPATMRMKVYIIDEAHMLTKEGANAFLKTLEEPPPHAVFILATTEPDKLPVTILSRCQRYTFRRISVPVIIEKLREIAKGEGIVINDEALSAIAYRADGGLRDALTMLEQIAAFAGGAPATAATLDLAFGATGRQFAAALLDACVRGDATAALAVVEEASDAGTDLQVLIRSLIAAWRNLLVARIDPQLLTRDLAPEDAARAGEQASTLSQAMLVRALRTFTEALALARSGGNARLELETALLRFILTGEDPTLDALSARLAALEEGSPVAVASQLPAAAPSPAASPPPAAPHAAPPQAAAKEAPPSGAPAPAKAGAALSVQKVRAAWQSIRGKVEGERQSLRAPLSRATIESLESNAIVLKLPDTWSAGALRDYAPLIEKAVADVLGVELKVVLRVDGSPGRAKSASRGGEPAAPAKDGDDADALFEYANERIR